MGLDITLYSVKEEPNDISFVINDYLDSVKKYLGKDVIMSKINDYYDWESIGITKDKYTWQATVFEDKKCIFELLDKKNKKIIRIEDTNIPIIKKEDQVIYGEEIGYQRKGFNKLFYDECKDYFVFAKERLEYIYNRYCENKKHFKECILNKFKEGKTFVTLNW